MPLNQVLDALLAEEDDTLDGDDRREPRALSQGVALQPGPREGPPPLLPQPDQARPRASRRHVAMGVLARQRVPGAVTQQDTERQERGDDDT